MIRRVAPQVEELSRHLEASDPVPALGVWTGYTNTRNHVLFMLYPTHCRLAWSLKGQESWLLDELRPVQWSSASELVIHPGYGKPRKVMFEGAGVLEEIRAAWPEHGRVTTPGSEAGAPPPRVSPRLVTTLPTVPGHHIVDVHGVVSQVASLSGWTAAAKGRGALERAFPDLLASASAVGANAVVGLQASSFAAAGGLTNMVGGDAVGVLLMGTAVTVEADSGP
ncbi:MAG: hypothetical protein ACXVW4_15485 [Nocardioides sp.]